MNRPQILATAIVFGVWAWSGTVSASGQVVLDGSLGPAGPRVGPDYIVPQSVGRRAGANLFHSFSRLNVNTGESVTFTAPIDDPGVARVIARVTGGEISRVDGLLRVAIAGADFYLVNPAGVALGPAAQLDVDGAVVVSTANSTRLADGVTFLSSPNPAGDALLSTAPPIAFGFLASPAGMVTYTGDATSQPLGLGPADGRDFSIVAAGVRLVGGRVQALGGKVSIVSVASTGEVTLADSTTSGFTSLGAVEVLGGASVRGPAGGGVVIRGGSLRVESSVLNADTDIAPSRGIDIDVAGGPIDLVNARVSSDTSGAAAGGNLVINADAITITGLSADGVTPVSTETRGSGRGGDVTLRARSIVITANGAITSSSTGPLAGDGGNIGVSATEEIRVNGAGSDFLTGLAAQTFDASVGNAGNITVAAPIVNLLERGELTTTTRGSGNAGVLDVTAGTLTVDGRNADTLTGLQARTGFVGGAGATGQGGQIVVKADVVRIIDGGRLSATTFGRGDGGGVSVGAGELDLQASDPTQFTGIFARSQFASGGGNGGDVEVRAGSLRVRGPAEISAASTGDGRAGNVNVAVEGSVLLERGGSVSVAAGFPDPRDVQFPDDPAAPPALPTLTDAGGLTLTAGRDVTLRSGGVISARATRDSGAVKINAPGIVYLVNSDITAEAGRTGGVIDIDPTAVVLSHSTINGLAGGQDVSVRIVADVLLTSDSAILTDTAVLPPEVDIAGSLTRLPGGLADVSAGLYPTCAAGARGGAANVSTFVQASRGGTPLDPTGFQPDLRRRQP